MIKKFLKLLTGHKLVQPSETDKKINFYIESKSYDLLQELLQAGYQLSHQQACSALQPILNYVEQDNSPQIFVARHIAQHNRSSFDSVFDSMIANNENSLFLFSFVKSEILKDLKQEQLETVMIETGRGYAFNHIHPIVKALYQEKFGSQHKKMLAKTGMVHTGLPQHILPMVERIKTIASEVDDALLGPQVKAEFKLMMDKTLPQILHQYSAIDKSLLGYKNADNKSVDDILMQGLLSIEEKLSQYLYDVEAAKIKDLKISSRHLSLGR